VGGVLICFCFHVVADVSMVYLRQGKEQYHDISKDSRCLGRDSNQTLPKHKAPPLEPIPSTDNFIKFKYDLYNTVDSSYYIASNNRIVNN